MTSGHLGYKYLSGQDIYLKMVSRRRSKGYRIRRRRYRARRRRSRGLANKIKNVLYRNVETSQYVADLNTLYSDIPNSWGYYYHVPLQSISLSKRIGRKIVMTGIELRGVLRHGATNSTFDDKYNVVRIIIGVAPYQPGVFQPLGSLSLHEPLERVRNQGQLISKKLYDRVITLQSPGPDSTGYMPHLKTIRIKRRMRLPVLFADDGANYPDKVLFIAIKSDSSAAPNPAFVQGWIKFTWKDI